MSKARKKLSIIILLCFVLTAVFTGCGAKQEEAAGATASEQTSSTATASTEELKEELKPVDLLWYQIGSPSSDTEKVVAEANKIIQEKINATLTYEILDWGEYQDKIAVKMAAAEEFDLCFTSSWANPYTTAVAKGAYAPLDELLDKYGPNVKEQVPEKFYEATKVDGKIYGVINYQYLATGQGLWFKKDVVDKLNLGDMINNLKDMDDMEPILKIVKENMKEVGIQYVIGFRLGGIGKNEKRTEQIFTTPFGVFMDDYDNLKVEKMLELPQTLEGLKRTRDWYLKGYVAKDVLSIKDWTPIEKAGTVFCASEGNVKPGVEVERAAKVGYDVIVKQLSPTTISYGGILATLTAISATSKNKERAMMLLDLLFADKELFNIMAFGLEGEHYTKIDEKTIEAVKDSKFNPGNTWAIANACNLYIQKGQDPNVWEVTKKMNEEAVKTPLFGFNLNVEPIKNEISQFEAIQKELMEALLAGAIDPTEGLAKINDKLNKAGLDKAHAEIQKQVDEFKVTRK